MGLLDLQKKWIEKFDEMREADYGPQLAAPFLSVPGEPNASTISRPILLVGKATGGCWKLDDFLSRTAYPIDKRVEERRNATENHLKFMMRERKASAFWRFWKALGEIGSPVIWTNLAKIGVVRGNPSHKCVEAQRELACATLSAEIVEYTPYLVVVACDYAKKQITYPVFGERARWTERGDGACWIDRTASVPAILWTDHPQGEKTEILRSWLEKARELVLRPQ
jgi:hypothetical protein